MKKLIISVWAFIALPLFAQRDANIRIYLEQGNQQISKHIYGQFAEHPVAYGWDQSPTSLIPKDTVRMS